MSIQDNKPNEQPVRPVAEFSNSMFRPSIGSQNTKSEFQIDKYKNKSAG